MIELELFAKMFVPIGYILGMGCIWYIMHVLFKDEIDNSDILTSCFVAFSFGFNLMFILWGVSLLNPAVRA